MLDTPVYKLLARNDTGQAPGHQGGIVIPGDIEDFFPDIEGTITPQSPTADVPIVADLVVDGRHRGTVATRYQYQTWGGTRSPERRLTSNLGPLRNEANPDDLVLFSRDPALPNRMTITLIRQGTPEYVHIVRENQGARWGIVPGFPYPVRNQDVRNAENEIEELSTSEFSLFEKGRQVLEVPAKKKARDAAFRKKLLQAYGARCLASGELLETPGGLLNVDAAHIVPVEVGGTDDPRNGLLLSKDLHWAFDKGLFSLGDDCSILLSRFARESAHCEAVKRLEGGRLIFEGAGLRPHPEAISWHRVNIFTG